MATALAGISFPFRTQDRGLPLGARGVEVVRSALILLLRTKRRSRVMRPEVGTNVHLLLFEDQGPITQSLIMREITSSIARQLPMVRVLKIDFREDGGILSANVRYNVQGVTDETGEIALPR